MRVRLFTVPVLLGLLVGVVSSQCYAPTYSDCAFRCGTVEPKCPDRYECRADGYCHLPDKTTLCTAPRDLGVVSDVGAAGGDTSVAADLSADATSPAVDADTD